MPTSTYPAQQTQQTSTGQTQNTQGMPPAGSIPPGQVQMPTAGTRTLPATGLQQQAAAIAGNNQGLQQANQQQGMLPRANLTRPGQTNLNDLAENLARNYGIQLGATPLVDEQGNFNRMPVGGQEAVGFQFISQALADEKNRRQNQKAEAALQTGLGQVQKRGRGSLASMQSGMFEALADQYASQQTKAADFSYFVQKEQLEKAEQLIARQERLAKKMGKRAMVGGIIGAAAGFMIGGPVGAAAGYSIGSGVGGGSSYF